MTARNRVSHAAGQQRRELIRELLLDHAHRFPLARSLTAREVAERLAQRGHYICPSTCAWHLSCIRRQADIEASTAGPCVAG